QPEIFAVTLEQGPARSSYYTSNVLSPGEKSVLTELSQAEAEVARLELLAMIRRQEMATENTMITERLRTQELLNTALATQLYYTYPPGLYPYGYGAPYGYGYGYGFGGYGLYGGPWTGGRAFRYPSMAPDYSSSAATVAASTPTTTQKGSAESISLMEALAKARERLASVQTKAVMEDGQVVAVVYEPKETKEK